MKKCKASHALNDVVCVSKGILWIKWNTEGFRLLRAYMYVWKHVTGMQHLPQVSEEINRNPKGLSGSNHGWSKVFIVLFEKTSNTLLRKAYVSKLEISKPYY